MDVDCVISISGTDELSSFPQSMSEGGQGKRGGKGAPGWKPETCPAEKGKWRHFCHLFSVESQVNHLAALGLSFLNRSDVIDHSCVCPLGFLEDHVNICTEKTFKNLESCPAV